MSSEYSPPTCSAWWLAGWSRATRIPRQYLHCDQYAYERLYERVRKAKKRAEELHGQNATNQGLPRERQ